MAEEVEMTPVEMTPVDETPIAGEPPKADPLKTAGAAPKTPTAAFKPGLKLPPKPGATVAALRPGLKLPPKPGATVTALRPGLKLPPKPGATVTALRPGLKLPPKPGATVTTLRPGLKLPPKPGATVVALKPAGTSPAPVAAPVDAAPAPEKTAAPVASVAPVDAVPETSATPAAPVAATPKPAIKPPVRPMIHKPGMGPTAMSLPKPVQSVPPPVAAKPAESVAEAPKPVEEPKPTAMPIDAQGVAKLPTVASAPVAREEVDKPETPSEQLKKVTQALKGLTQQIPQQAILRKTGIIAEDATTVAQKEAAKHKTARISLSEAIGVAPVKNENAPMKTIRIKRPIDIPGATASKPAQESNAELTSSAASGVSPVEDAPTAVTMSPEPATTITQRKTLKIARPGGGAVRPAGRFGVKRPSSQATTVVKKPVGGAEPPAEGAPAETPAAEIADIPSLPSIPDMPAPVAAADTTPGWLYALSALVQAAACLGVGALAWLLYQGTQTLFY